MTLEDPVEYPMTRIRQTSVNESVKLGFANGVRSLLRQDPDIILVGEIRDADTAAMTFRAAMTGHQVYSTLHTSSAVGAIARLRDIGVAPGVLAGNIIGIVAQRLVRRLCPACRSPVASGASRGGGRGPERRRGWRWEPVRTAKREPMRKRRDSGRGQDQPGRWERERKHERPGTRERARVRNRTRRRRRVCLPFVRSGAPDVAIKGTAAGSRSPKSCASMRRSTIWWHAARPRASCSKRRNGRDSSLSPRTRCAGSPTARRRSRRWRGSWT